MELVERYPGLYHIYNDAQIFIGNFTNHGGVWLYAPVSDDSAYLNSMDLIDLADELTELNKKP